MKIAVFGATGGAGLQVVEQALAAGDEVVAYLRNLGRLPVQHDRLSVIQGELSDGAALEEAIAGADAVISTLGPSGGSHGRPLTRGIRNILAAMAKTGVRRLIVSSGAGARDPNDRFDLKFRFLVALLWLAIPQALADVIGLSEAVRQSGCDWTIVRVPPLHDGPRTGRIRAGYLGQGSLRLRLCRADMADFMLKQVRDLKYLQQAPMISN